MRIFGSTKKAPLLTKGEGWIFSLNAKINYISVLLSSIEKEGLCKNEWVS